MASLVKEDSRGAWRLHCKDLILHGIRVHEP